jgi:ribosomal protein L12E/L44/L45/RPP1/RPP2
MMMATIPSGKKKEEPKKEEPEKKDINETLFNMFG